jgi:hypothetical protein
LHRVAVRLLVQLWICGFASQFAFRAVQLVGQLLANDGQLGWRFNANPNSAVTQLNDRHGDLIADENSLANLTTEN